ncbi:MAG: hypothetical protein ACREUG_05440 [Steroidobacteraceae bacterium]
MRLATGFLAAALLLTLTIRTDEAKTMSGMRTFTYVHLYSDAHGVSHFRDETVTLKTAVGPHGGPDEALAAYTLSAHGGAQLLSLKRGASEDWHNAPRRMFLIVVQGTAEVTASDGEVRRFGPGSVLLMDDATGKGHITRNVGPADHVAVTIPAPAG